VSDYLTNLIGQQRPKNTVPVPTATPAPKLLPNSLQDAGNELLGNLGIAGRGLVQGAVSPITMVADPLTEFVNKTFGAKQKLPSQAVSEGLTALGVPQAKDDAQRILEAATSGLAGGGAIAKTAQLAGKGAGLAKGYLDTIGKDLAGQMTSGLGSGAGSVGASQAATASGASPVVAQLAGLGGGLVGGGARPVKGPVVKTSVHEDTGLPLNQDGTVTLYHGTTKAGADAITSTGKLQSAGEPHVYLTTDPNGGGYGDGAVVAIKVNPNKINLDDEFPDGRKDFSLSVGKPGGSVPVVVVGAKPVGGNVSNLSSKQQSEVRSPAFKSLFGDWEKDPTNATKVIDENGEPLVVYHGTEKPFSSFDPNKSADSTFWFTSNPKKLDLGESGAAGHGVKMPVYLNIKNPAGWDEYDKLTTDQMIREGFDGLKLDDDYVAFSPSQIKSATGNKGFFDPKSHDIYK
jgi:hypothetical protein